MDKPTQEELSRAVADVLGWLGCTDNGCRKWYSPDRPIQDTLTEHPAQDWNALMAAVAKLEDSTEPAPLMSFKRGAGWWTVHINGVERHVERWYPGDSEALALAKCIYAAREQRTSTNT